MKITYGIFKSPFGWCVIAVTADNQEICNIAFLDRGTKKEAETAIIEVWPQAKISRDNGMIEPFANAVFGLEKKKSKKSIKLKLKLSGTNFQIKVWDALLLIPKGKTTTYSAIAKQIGLPKAVRAVGSACGKNHIAFIVPCHRVLTSAGKLGGYRWGTKLKGAMLAFESVKNSPTE